jgi:PAS domain S-box-containing protein
MTEFKKDANRELRQKAEHLIAQTNALPEDLTGMSPQQIAGLVHELRVHQVELKMQNDELRRIQVELEKARDRYLHLYDFAPTAYFTVDEKGAVAEANLTAANLLDRPRKALVGRMFSRFIHRDDQDIWYLHRKRLLETGNFQSLQIRLLKSDGGVFYVNLECMPAEESGSEAKVIRIAATDITGLKRAEQALQQVNTTLEQRVAERADLAETRARQLQALAVELIEAEERERQRIAELLHEDLQQMLAAARFQLQAAQVNLPNEPNLECVNVILEESIAKSRRLSHELSPPVLYHGSLYNALEWLGRQMNEQFGLKVELQDEKSPYLEKTPLKLFLFRAVQELLFNIVKHAGVKSARVALAGSNGNVTVTVSDQGKGFNKDIIDTFREKAGFGLISIRERAERIGGYLKIESEPGQGSSFILYMPVQTAVTEEPFKARKSTDAAAQKTVSLNTGLRVLFADDHKVIRHGLIRLISAHPEIEVVGEAANGREAIELARHLRPDVIVMDISMPEIDGIEATRLIKSEFPDMRIIGLSMFEDEQSVKNIINAGADTFVPKTASSAKLLKAIYGNRK